METLLSQPLRAETPSVSLGQRGDEWADPQQQEVLRSLPSPI